MKAIKPLVLAAALTAAGVLGTMDAQAARGSGGVSGGSHWSGGHSSGGGHWSGGGRGHWGGGRFWGPSFGFYLGAPLFYGAYWGSPYWGYPYDYYYPRTVIVDQAVERYPQSYPQGVMESAPTTEVPRSAGAPTQGPTYMNFCASANAYYPKVTSCPEGWKFLPSR
jgi:hypothetical protein